MSSDRELDGAVFRHAWLYGVLIGLTAIVIGAVNLRASPFVGTVAVLLGLLWLIMCARSIMRRRSRKRT